MSEPDTQVDGASLQFDRAVSSQPATGTGALAVTCAACRTRRRLTPRMKGCEIE